jgi:hypothetical protein
MEKNLFQNNQNLLLKSYFHAKTNYKNMNTLLNKVEQFEHEKCEEYEINSAKQHLLLLL